jgi:hypothetical protein
MVDCNEPQPFRRSHNVQLHVRAIFHSALPPSETALTRVDPPARPPVLQAVGPPARPFRACARMLAPSCSLPGAAALRWPRTARRTAPAAGGRSPRGGVGFRLVASASDGGDQQTQQMTYTDALKARAVADAGDDECSRATGAHSGLVSPKRASLARGHHDWVSRPPPGPDTLSGAAHRVGGRHGLERRQTC